MRRPKPRVKDVVNRHENRTAKPHLSGMGAVIPVKMQNGIVVCQERFNRFEPISNRPNDRRVIGVGYYALDGRRRVGGRSDSLTLATAKSRAESKQDG